MAPASFGLTPEYKLDIHKTLMVTAHYSKGAFSVIELYQMPVYLRDFYIREFGLLKQKEAEELKRASKKR